MKKMTLEEIGYNAHTDSLWEDFEEKDKYSLARVTTEHKGAYSINDAAQEYVATVTGKRMFKASSREEYPAVGDWVAISKDSEDKATIHHILPRKTILKRKYNKKEGVQIIAANVDYAFIVEAVGRDYNLNRFERYVVLAKEGGVVPVIILNKTDLEEKSVIENTISEIEERFENIKVIQTSIISGEGIKDLKEFVTNGNTYCFLGSSGVGKSSLINELLNDTSIEVQETGVHSKRGKHTTTKREMYILDEGGVVIDNPGTREVGVVEAEDGLLDVFEEIISLSGNCKFADCSHIHEPGCAILSAIKSGELDEDKYENFLRLRKENDHHEMTSLERRDKNKKFGKFVKKTIEEKKKNQI